MYKFSRLLLVFAVLLGARCLQLLAIGAEAWVVVAVIVVVVGRVLQSRRRRLTTLGSARWADASELREAGMLDAESGLILGRTETKSDKIAAIKNLFLGAIEAKTACRDFFAAFKRRRKPVVRMPNAVHTAVFSPSGGGKGVSCAVPYLLTCDESCVVVDFKGELSQLTADHRRKAFGHQVVLLDPYKQVTKTPDVFNPLAFIDKDSVTAIDECNDLAKALVIRTGEEKEPHWNDSAEAWIAAMLATVVRYGEAGNGTRSLQAVREILSDPQKLDMALKLMKESDAWDGMLARMGGQLAHFVDKERSSTLTTVSRHLRFLDTVVVAENTKESNFDPAGLRAGKMTVYLILPPDHMRAQSALLRMWIGSLLRAVIRGGLQETNKVHFILDEATSLGHLDAVDDAVDKYRGYGVRLQLYFQSLGQLRKCFPEGQDQTLLSNTSQVFFGVNDNATAEYVSNRLGEATIIVDSGGTSRGTSHQTSCGAQQSSTSWSENTSWNWQQQARRLLKPDEVMVLSPRTAITFAPGVPPIRTALLRYYEERKLGKRPGWFRRTVAACATLGASMVLFLFMLSLALALGEAARTDSGPSPVANELTQMEVQR